MNRAFLTRYAWVSIFAALLTLGLKTLAWYLTGSVGLLSDAIETLVNLAGGIMALAMLTVAARPADEDHAYGHGKAEYFSSGVEGTLIVLAAASIGRAAVRRLLAPQPLAQVGLGLAVAVAASLVNLAVALLLLRISRKHDSITLEANARHLLADVWTSVGVVLGVAAVALTDWRWLDPVLAMRGRAHYYEGYSMPCVTLPIRVMRALGIGAVIVTNAAGGVNENFHTGDLMLITDHINLVGMTGANPLRGPNDESLGPRFPDMTDAYDPALCDLTRAVAREVGIALREGVYMMLAGPSFESPADVRFIRAIGADAVGMSTVSEVIVARHGGMRVLGLSLISNSLAHGHDKVSHDEVLAAGKSAAPQLVALIKGVLARMD